MLTKACATAYTKRCSQSAKTKYNTEYDTKCETTYLKNCFPVPRKVPDRECRTEYDQVCTQNTQTITKTRTDTQCKDIVKRVSMSNCSLAPVCLHFTVTHRVNLSLYKGNPVFKIKSDGFQAQN